MNISLKHSSLSHYINYFILLYAFLLPISRAGISTLSALMFLLWLFEGSLKEKFSMLIKNRVTFTIMLFYLFTLFSLLWTQNIVEGLVYLKRYWYLLPILVIATHLKKENIFKVISAFLLGMLISEVISYGIFFELWTTKHGSVDDPTPFMNHLQYSMFLGFTALLLLNKSFFETDLKWKISYFFYFLLTTSSLFINGGRTGQAAFLVGIFVVGFINIKNKLIALLTITLLASTIFISAYNLSPVFKSRALTTQSEINLILHDTQKMYHSSFGYRLAAWYVGINIFQENPIIGTGVGSEIDALKLKITELNREEFKISKIFEIKHYHNNYITYLVQLGLVGLLLYLTIFYTLGSIKIQSREINNLKYIFIAIFMTASMFEQMFYAQFPLAFFALFTGLFIAVAQAEKETGI